MPRVVIAFFEGAKTPFVLRQLDTAERGLAFQLVGTFPSKV
jgi:hypothetical protein